MYELHYSILPNMLSGFSLVERKSLWIFFRGLEISIKKSCTTASPIFPRKYMAFDDFYAILMIYMFTFEWTPFLCLEIFQAFVKEIGTAGASGTTSGGNTGNNSTSIANGIGGGGANGSISGSTVSSSSDGRPGHSTTPTATTSGAGKESRKARNLESYVKWFNRLCYIISTDVCKVRLSVSRTK